MSDTKASYVVDDLKHLAGWNTKQEEGYIIAFLNRPGHYDLARTDAKYRTLFAQWRKGRDQIIGGGLTGAFIFKTYQEAADAAAGWAHTNNETTRIIKVKTQARFEVFEDYPINLCDVLAEL